jgi:hypothetical protein
VGVVQEDDECDGQRKWSVAEIGKHRGLESVESKQENRAMK